MFFENVLLLIAIVPWNPCMFKANPIPFELYDVNACQTKGKLKGAVIFLYSALS